MEPALEDLRRIRRRLHENRAERTALIGDRATAFVAAHRGGASAAELAAVLEVPVVDVEMALRATFPPDEGAPRGPRDGGTPAAASSGVTEVGGTAVDGPAIPSAEESPAPR